MFNSLFTPSKIKERLVSLYSNLFEILRNDNKTKFPSSINSPLCIIVSSNYEFFVGFKSRSLSQGNMAFLKEKTTYLMTITTQSFNFNLKVP